MGFSFDGEVAESLHLRKVGSGPFRNFLAVPGSKGVTGDVEAKDFGCGLRSKVRVLDDSLAIINPEAPWDSLLNCGDD